MSIGAVNVNSIVFILFFIIPGFVTVKFMSFFAPTHERNPTRLLLDSISYSCINFVLSSWLILLVARYGFLDLSLKAGQISNITFLILAAILVFTLFVGPILVALGVLKLREHTPVKRFPTAWDNFFQETKKSYWVMVTFDNGKKIAGLYRKGSAVSSYPAEKDFYIKETWELDENDKFKKPVENTAGVWIDIDKVRHIQFWEW